MYAKSYMLFIYDNHIIALQCNGGYFGMNLLRWDLISLPSVSLHLMMCVRCMSVCKCVQMCVNVCKCVSMCVNVCKCV